MTRTTIIFTGTYLFLTVLVVVLICGPMCVNKSDADSKKGNVIVFVWEGLEKDIPEKGDYIQITGTDENTVYLNAIDE